MNERVGLYGGSFDPIHFGHLIGARSIAEQLGMTRVILIPSPRPPHKRDQTLTDPLHRLEMTRRAVDGETLFEVSDVELHREGPSYTFDTVAEFRRCLGSAPELFWIIGADTLPELPTWYRIAELTRAVRIVTLARSGWQPPEASFLEQSVGHQAAEQLLRDCLPTPAIDIRARDIRARVREGRSVRYLIPEAIESYIRGHSLYRA
jgi:nicotinate-nucleotide adenylyltransferase